MTIVIPCFNLATYLPEATESALSQTHEPVQVVIVDDGSTDGTAEAARRFGDRVVYHRQPNGGLSRARNAGLALARGEYVVFLDADDVLEPVYVERCLDALRGADASCAYVYTQLRYFGLQEGVTNFPPFDGQLLKAKNFVHASALLRTDVVRRFPYCEQLRHGWEDWDLYLTLAEHGLRGVLLDEPLLRYRRRPGSMLTDLDADRRLAARVRLARRHLRSYGLRRYLRLSAALARRGLLRRARRLPDRRSAGG